MSESNPTAAAEFDTVLYTVSAGVATVTMNRPEARNAFDNQLRLDLAAAVDLAAKDDAVRVIVLAGAGNGFSAGHDLNNALGGYESISKCIEAEYRPFLEGLRLAPKLVIASVHGAAAGIGGALMMACDFAIMSESAYLYQAFLPIALVPDGGATWHLTRTLGQKRAMELFIEARKIPAGECVELGLANRVVTDDDLAEETRVWAERLAKGAPIAQRLTKQLVHSAMNEPLPDMISAEALAQDQCSLSKDSLRAVEAFFNKQPPVFEGN